MDALGVLFLSEQRVSALMVDHAMPKRTGSKIPRIELGLGGVRYEVSIPQAVPGLLLRAMSDRLTRYAGDRQCHSCRQAGVILDHRPNDPSGPRVANAVESSHHS